MAERSYNWELMHLIERQQEEGAPGWFDFCFFDGGHTWETDGFALLLVDKLCGPTAGSCSTICTGRRS
ncbi:MAG TPA: hypothetical protein VK287_06410 [Gaiellaceae bacterium]|nr:hypothetical protein [Gaiellaceae bacterium]